MNNRYQTLWNDRYQQLINFKETFGHCNVTCTSKEYPQLAGWVIRQRKEYRKYQNGAQTSLTQDRIEKLKDIDFSFDVNQAKFENNLKQVLQFKKRYGHCRIPRTYQPNVPLGVWVRYIRREHRRYEQGEKSFLKKKQVDELKSIGFFEKDEAGSHGAMKRNSELNTERKLELNRQWNEMYQQLQAFKQEHGHCIVRRYDPKHTKLGGWVICQRRSYKKLQNGEINPMSQDRLDKLKAVGFCFGVHDAQWQENLQNLEEFKQLHGHLNVPRIYPPNQLLSGWIRSVRKKYRLYLQGNTKESQLTKERVDSLNRIGLKPHAKMNVAPSSQKPRARSAGVRRTHGRDHGEDAPNSHKLPRTNSAKQEIAQPDLTVSVVSSSVEKDTKASEEVEWDSDASSSSSLQNLDTNDDDEDWSIEDTTSHCSFQNLGTSCNGKEDGYTTVPRTRSSDKKNNHDMGEDDSIRREDNWIAEDSRSNSFHSLSAGNDQEETDDENDSSFICIV